MDLGQMRAHVREWIDVDEFDLPDSVLDPIFDDGAIQIADAERQWPWLRSSWSVSVPGGSELGVDLTGEQISEITVLRTSDGKHLEFIDLDSALLGNFGGQGQPVAWSFQNDSLALWPTPTDTTSVLLSGYRRMNVHWALTASSVPDCPEDYHQLIRMWGLRGAYLQQDDPETASVWAQEFAQQLGMKVSRASEAPSAPPIVLNGGMAGHRSAMPANPSVWRFNQ